MDVAWQDSVRSFLDWSGTDPSSFASFASDDGAALWSSSPDSPIFSDQPVLWESSLDSLGESHISALTRNDIGGSNAGPLLAGSDAASGLAGGAVLDGGLLWTGAGSDTSSTLANNGGVGLGALDLGASSSVSLWQQLLSLSTPAETWFQGATQLLWTGAACLPQVTVPILAGSQSVRIAAGDSLPAAALGNLAPPQLLWTQPSGATGPTTGLSLTDAAPVPVLSGAGITGSPSSNLPLAGAGSHA